MRYLPKSPADREVMLREIGVHSVDDFFKAIPAEYRLNRDLKVTRQLGESEIVDYFQQRAAECCAGYANFLGAGAYHASFFAETNNIIRGWCLWLRRYEFDSQPHHQHNYVHVT